MAADVQAGRVKLAPSTGPRVSEWSPIRAALADVCDRLAILTIAVLAAGGAKSLPEFKATARPETALARAAVIAEREAEMRLYLEYVAMFTPHALPRFQSPGSPTPEGS